MHFKNWSIEKKLCLILAIAVVIFVIAHELKLYFPALQSWLETLGAFAPLGFIALFVVLTPVFISVDTLCFTAGLLFSIAAAEFYMLIATYLAATVIFFLGRHLFKEKVVTFIAKHQQFSALDEAINEQPLKLMFLLRLTPLPFALLSYALSVTEVRFWSYLLATSGILLYNASLVYMGHTTKLLAGFVSGSKTQVSVSYPLLFLGIVISVLVLFYVTKTAEASIHQLSLKKSQTLR